MKFSEIVALKNVSDDAIIARALSILEERAIYKVENPMLQKPDDVRSYLRLTLGGLEHEEFYVIFLAANHQVISADSIFRGSLTSTSVYPREIVKLALTHNAAAVILAHNHPSGNIEPSAADQSLTKALKQAPDLIDVRVLDHLVVTSHKVFSIAEAGLI